MVMDNFTASVWTLEVIEFSLKEIITILVRHQGDTKVVKSIVWMLLMQGQAFSSDTFLSVQTWLLSSKWWNMCVKEDGTRTGSAWNASALSDDQEIYHGQELSN